jgi:hypothetical protein
MADSIPRLKSLMDVLYVGGINLLWGDPGKEREDLIKRVVRDWLSGGGTLVSQPAFPENEDPHLIPTWGGLLNWIKLQEPDQLLIAQAPLNPGESEASYLQIWLGTIQDQVSKSQVTLLLVCNLSFSNKTRLTANPTAEIELGPKALQYFPGCILYQNEVIWPSAINVLKTKSSTTPPGLYFLPEIEVQQNV